MRIKYAIVVAIFLLCSACEWRLKPNEEDDHRIEVARYDRMESVYLTTGDFSALQQMETNYPMETRTLIENVLKLGAVNDPEINNRFLAFFQDTTLQVLISDAEARFANMDDVNKLFNQAFGYLKEHIPGIPVPTIYAQIGALDQSIVVGDQSVGISLDKYLGKDYPVYKRFYTEQQRATMNRENIVPDAISFYLISLYPIPNFELRMQEERDFHMGKMMWVTNQALGRKVFRGKFVDKVEILMRKHPNMTVEKLMGLTDYSQFI